MENKLSETNTAKCRVLKTFFLCQKRKQHLIRGFNKIIIIGFGSISIESDISIEHVQNDLNTINDILSHTKMYKGSYVVARGDAWLQTHDSQSCRLPESHRLADHPHNYTPLSQFPTVNFTKDVRKIELFARGATEIAVADHFLPLSLPWLYLHHCRWDYRVVKNVEN